MPWPGRDDDGRADTTSVWARIESPGMTGAGKAISSNPRLATVVPSVVSNTDRPMSSDSVNRLLTTRVPNSVVSAKDSSRCSGCAFMVRTENSVLSASVIVRVTAWSITVPGVRSSNQRPITGRGAVMASVCRAGPQLVLDHLARGVHRQLGEDHDGAGHLVVGHLVPAPGQDRRAAVRVAGAGHDERHAHLAQPFVRDADHRGLGHVGGAQEAVLDLGRVGVEAADNEHGLGPAHDAQAAALVHDAEVAGAQPALR